MNRTYKRILIGVIGGGIILSISIHIHPAFFLLTIGFISFMYHTYKKVTRKGTFE